MDVVTLKSAEKRAKKYTDEAIAGAGAVKGKSAYQIAVDNGFVGTEKQWLASLKGEPGIDGVDGTSATITVGNVTSGAAPNVSNRGTPQAAILDFVLQRGEKGDAGRDGRDGRNGADGKSFTIKAQYASYADLIADHPTGQPGDAFFVGTSNNPDLYVWLADSSEWFNSGPISGVKGDAGRDGQDGDDGYSPTATVTSDSTGVEIRITDKNGTTTAHVNNGNDGSDGGDGYSPTVTVKTNTSNTYILTVTYKDANGDVQTFDTPNLKGAGGSGGGNGVVFAYVVDESEEFSDEWLSETDGGEALTPNEELLYIVLSEGDYQNLIYRFDGTNYVDVNGGGYWEGNIFEYKQLPRIDVDKFYYVNGYDATASSSSEFEPYTIDHVLLFVANGTYTLRIKSTLTKASANGLRLTIEDDVVNKIITEVTSMRISASRIGSPRINSGTSITDSSVFITIDPKYGSAYKTSVDLDITGNTTYTGSFEHLYLGKVLFRPLEEIGTNSEGGGAVFAYVVSGSTEFSDGWLSDKNGGKALTPDEKLLYVVVSNSRYKDKIYRYDGTKYVEVSKTPNTGGGSTEYEVIAVGVGTTNADILSSFYPYLQSMSSAELEKTIIRWYSSNSFDIILYYPAHYKYDGIYEYGTSYCFNQSTVEVDVLGIKQTNSFYRSGKMRSDGTVRYVDYSDSQPTTEVYELIKVKDALPADTKKITIATYSNQSFQAVGNDIVSKCTSFTDEELESFRIKYDNCIFRFASHLFDGNVEVFKFSSTTASGPKTTNMAFICRSEGNSFFILSDISIGGTVNTQVLTTEQLGSAELYKLISEISLGDNRLATVYADGVKTYAQLLNQLYASLPSYNIMDSFDILVNFNGIGVMTLYSLFVSSENIGFSNIAISSNKIALNAITLSNNSTYNQLIGTDITALTSTVPEQGTTISIRKNN